MTMLMIDLPKAGDWGYTQEAAMREMENWGLAMGAPAVPKVRDDLLRKIVGHDRMTKLRGQSYGGNRLPAVFTPGEYEEDFGRDHFKAGRDWEGGRDGGRRRGFESGGRRPRSPGRGAGGSRSTPHWERR